MACEAFEKVRDMFHLILASFPIAFRNKREEAEILTQGIKYIISKFII